jgi:RimJ/RimL family protein N-acetyltransferase
VHWPCRPVPDRFSGPQGGIRDPDRDKEHQGKGLGKTVAKAVLAFGFEELNLHRISLRVIATNAQAIRLYESVGMRRDGILRDEYYRGGKCMDTLIYLILDIEWMRGMNTRDTL